MLKLNWLVLILTSSLDLSQHLSTQIINLGGWRPYNPPQLLPAWSGDPGPTQRQTKRECVAAHAQWVQPGLLASAGVERVSGRVRGAVAVSTGPTLLGRGLSCVRVKWGDSVARPCHHHQCLLTHHHHHHHQWTLVWEWLCSAVTTVSVWSCIEASEVETVEERRPSAGSSSPVTSAPPDTDQWQHHISDTPVKTQESSSVIQHHHCDHLCKRRKLCWVKWDGDRESRRRLPLQQSRAPPVKW